LQRSLQGQEPGTLGPREGRPYDTRGPREGLQAWNPPIGFFSAATAPALALTLAAATARIVALELPLVALPLTAATARVVAAAPQSPRHGAAAPAATAFAAGPGRTADAPAPRRRGGVGARAAATGRIGADGARSERRLYQRAYICAGASEKRPGPSASRRHPCRTRTGRRAHRVC